MRQDINCCDNNFQDIESFNKQKNCIEIYIYIRYGDFIESLHMIFLFYLFLTEDLINLLIFLQELMSINEVLLNQQLFNVNEQKLPLQNEK